MERQLSSRAKEASEAGVVPMTNHVGEDFAFRRWMLHWGYAYGSKVTNESALWVWEQKKVRA